MEKIQLAYTVTVSDFRKASYYGLFLRQRRSLQIMFVVLAAAVLYGIGSALGLGEANPLVFSWQRLILPGDSSSLPGRSEASANICGRRGIFSAAHKAVLESHRVQFEIPERNIRVSKTIGDLTCVFELSQLFLIYTSTQDLYILPYRALTEAQRTALRETFRQRLGDRFAGRFR